MEVVRTLSLITTFLAVVATLAFICADVVKLKLWDVSWSLAAAALAADAAAVLSVANMNALQGLAPVSALGNTDPGKAALASNFKITGDIQSGAVTQPLLESFLDQRQQALRDDFITTVAYELADGLGSKLGDAYRKEATNNPPSGGDCKTLKFTSILPAVARPITF